jgi:DNA repair exonuclease SbcCD ATPase subunit
MDDRQKNILKLEQDASRLVDELGALKRQVSSYRTATDELDKARSSLAGFLDTTQNLTQQSHKLIGAINEIGSAKIFAELEALRAALAENEKRTTKRRLFFIIGLVLIFILQIVTLIILKTGG